MNQVTLTSKRLVGGGFMTPAGTPQAIIDRYHDEIVKILAQPDVRDRLTHISLRHRRQHAQGV